MEWQPIETMPIGNGSDYGPCVIVAEHIFDDLWNYDIARKIDRRIVRAWDHSPYKEHEANWTHWAMLNNPSK